MGGSRISVARLTGVVLIAAFGFAALHSATKLWASAWVAFVFLSLGIGSFGYRYRTGVKRDFCAGFTLFGIAYFVAAFGPMMTGDWLPTAALIEPLKQRVNPPGAGYMLGDFRGRLDGSLDHAGPANYGSMQSLESVKASFQWRWDHGDRRWNPANLSVRPCTDPFHEFATKEPFRRIYHALFTLTIGAMGGMIMVFLPSSLSKFERVPHSSRKRRDAGKEPFGQVRPAHHFARAVGSLCP